MSEYFEITFFLEKEKAKKEQSKNKMLQLLSIREGREKVLKHQYLIFVGKEVLFDDFEYEDVDFLEYRICLSKLVFTKNNFDEKINQLMQIMSIWFSQIGSIVFATGIYELTYDYIEGIKTLKEFNNEILSQFPLLFFKNGNEYGFIPSKYLGNTSCVVNMGENVQDIFASPIGELMEDEGLSFEEAHNDLYNSDFEDEYAKRFDMSLEKAHEILTNLQKNGMK
ncbi:MAG: hypothetical protein FWD71_16915 [Oscillospiraceae bacterium]|nr:hypothetical protein [Oscillospiraceae bacterium]